MRRGAQAARAVGERVAWALASHAFRSRMMTCFYAGIFASGVLGVIIPSASAEAALPDRIAVILWTMLYGIFSPVAALARARSYFRTEALALTIIIVGTALHGLFLIAGDSGGLQTGVRLSVGGFAFAAIASALHELALRERRTPPGSVVVGPHLVAQEVRRALAERRGS